MHAWCSSCRQRRCKCMTIRGTAADAVRLPTVTPACMHSRPSWLRRTLHRNTSKATKASRQQMLSAEATVGLLAAICFRFWTSLCLMSYQCKTCSQRAVCPQPLGDSLLYEWDWRTAPGWSKRIVEKRSYLTTLLLLF